jgi:hypothetical protein
MKQLVPNFLDRNIIQVQNYLFAAYKQYIGQACPCIDQGVVQVPKMKPAKNVSYEYTQHICFT